MTALVGILACAIFVGLFIVAWLGLVAWSVVGWSIPILIGVVIAAARFERSLSNAWRN